MTLDASEQFEKIYGSTRDLNYKNELLKDLLKNEVKNENDIREFLQLLTLLYTSAQSSKREDIINQDIIYDLLIYNEPNVIDLILKFNVDRPDELRVLFEKLPSDSLEQLFKRISPPSEKKSKDFLTLLYTKKIVTHKRITDFLENIDIRDFLYSALNTEEGKSGLTILFAALNEEDKFQILTKYLVATVNTNINLYEENTAYQYIEFLIYLSNEKLISNKDLKIFLFATTYYDTPLMSLAMRTAEGRNVLQKLYDSNKELQEEILDIVAPAIPTDLVDPKEVESVTNNFLKLLTLLYQKASIGINNLLTYLIPKKNAENENLLHFTIKTESGKNALLKLLDKLPPVEIVHILQKNLRGNDPKDFLDFLTLLYQKRIIDGAGLIPLLAYEDPKNKETLFFSGLSNEVNKQALLNLFKNIPSLSTIELLSKLYINLGGFDENSKPRNDFINFLADLNVYSKDDERIISILTDSTGTRSLFIEWLGEVNKDDIKPIINLLKTIDSKKLFQFLKTTFDSMIKNQANYKPQLENFFILLGDLYTEKAVDSQYIGFILSLVDFEEASPELQKYIDNLWNSKKSSFLEPENLNAFLIALKNLYEQGQKDLAIKFLTTTDLGTSLLLLAAQRKDDQAQQTLRELFHSKSMNSYDLRKVFNANLNIILHDSDENLLGVQFLIGELRKLEPLQRSEILRTHLVSLLKNPQENKQKLQEFTAFLYDLYKNNVNKDEIKSLLSYLENEESILLLGRKDLDLNKNVNSLFQLIDDKTYHETLRWNFGNKEPYDLEKIAYVLIEDPSLMENIIQPGNFSMEIFFPEFMASKKVVDPKNAKYLSICRVILQPHMKNFSGSNKEIIEKCYNRIPAKDKSPLSEIYKTLFDLEEKYKIFQTDPSYKTLDMEIKTAIGEFMNAYQEYFQFVTKNHLGFPTNLDDELKITQKLKQSVEKIAKHTDVNKHSNCLYFFNFMRDSFQNIEKIRSFNSSLSRSSKHNLGHFPKPNPHSEIENAKNIMEDICSKINPVIRR